MVRAVLRLQKGDQDHLAHDYNPSKSRAVRSLDCGYRKVHWALMSAAAGRDRADDAHDLSRPRLRPRSERPRRSRTSNHFDEIATSHAALPSGPIPKFAAHSDANFGI